MEEALGGRSQRRDGRVIKGMYSVVQSAVLVGDEQTEWFDLSTGVRQGCVMSPYIILNIYQWISEKDQCRNKGNKSRREE